MWLVRIGTKVTGPYDLDQLRILRQRKQFSPVHQVSSTGGDRWESAAQLIEMIDGEQHWTPPQNSLATATTNSGQVAPRPQWYYVNGEQKQVGPVPENSLRDLFQARRLSARTMVCREGDTNWQEARKRAEFAGAVSASRKTWLFVTSGVAAVAVASVIGFVVLHSQEPGGGVGDESSSAEPHISSKEQEEQVIQRATLSVARITTRRASGSGFLVAPDILVTNRHVVEGEIAELIKARFPSAPKGEQGPYSVSILYEHEDRDLAFLKINTNLPNLEIAPQSAFRGGRPVIVIGNPASELTDSTPDGALPVVINAISRGTMSAEVNVNGKAFYHFDITVNHGNSGGPAMNSEGQVIAVVDIGDTNPGQDRLNYFIPSYEVKASVERLKRLTEKEITANAAKHQAKAIYVTTDDASSQRIKFMDRFLANGGIHKPDASEEELKKGLEKNDLHVRLLIPYLSGIAADPSLSAPIREDLQGLVANFLELYNLEHALWEGKVLPLAQWKELTAAHQLRAEALEALLGPPILKQLFKE